MRSHHLRDDVTVEIAALRPTLIRAGRLLIETVIVPSLLMAVLLRMSGLVAAVSAALGWTALVVAIRWISDRRMPGTVLLCAGMISTRAALALITSSAAVYLIQPLLASCFMAALFLGSALIGKPITERLARDFVSLPAEVLNRRAIRRLFTEVAILWGLSRLADAGMNLSFLRWSVDAGLLSRGLISPVLTGLSICLCTWWGIRSFRKEGITLKLARHHHPPVPTPVPAEAVAVADQV
jgi:intracellular septation protein A